MAFTAAEKCPCLSKYLISGVQTGTSLCPLAVQVRWADLEQLREEQKKREIGFCIGAEWRPVSQEEAESLLRGEGGE